MKKAAIPAHLEPFVELLVEALAEQLITQRQAEELLQRERAKVPQSKVPA